jgi:hypothetical protein
MGTTTGIIPSVVDGQSSDLGVTAVILVSNIGTIYIGQLKIDIRRLQALQS